MTRRTEWRDQRGHQSRRRADGGAHSGVTVDGTIEQNAWRTRPIATGIAGACALPIFKISDDGTEARRVTVQVGHVSEDGTEIVGGLRRAIA